MCGSPDDPLLKDPVDRSAVSCLEREVFASVGGHDKSNDGPIDRRLDSVAQSVDVLLVHGSVLDEMFLTEQTQGVADGRSIELKLLRDIRDALLSFGDGCQNLQSNRISEDRQKISG